LGAPRRAPRRASLWTEPPAALAAATLNREPPRARPHARAKAVRASPLALLRLVGALHAGSQSIGGVGARPAGSVGGCSQPLYANSPRFAHRSLDGGAGALERPLGESYTGRRRGAARAPRPSRTYSPLRASSHLEDRRFAVPEDVPNA